MTRIQRHRYETFVRVRNFGTANQPLFPESSTGGQLFAAVSSTVDTIEQHLSNRVIARAEARKVKAATRRAVYEYVKAVASTARRVTHKDPDTNPFVIPARRSTSIVLSTARAFLAEAGKRQEEFVRLGLPATFVGDFTKITDELEAAMSTQLSSKTDRRLAQAGIAKALETGLETIRDLDVVVRNTLRLDPVRVEAWRAARRIEGLNPPVAAKPTAKPADAPAADPAAAAPDGKAPLEKVSGI